MDVQESSSSANATSAGIDAGASSTSSNNIKPKQLKFIPRSILRRSSAPPTTTPSTIEATASGLLASLSSIVKIAEDDTSSIVGSVSDNKDENDKKSDVESKRIINGVSFGVSKDDSSINRLNTSENIVERKMMLFHINDKEEESVKRSEMDSRCSSRSSRGQRVIKPFPEWNPSITGEYDPFIPNSYDDYSKLKIQRAHKDAMERMYDRELDLLQVCFWKYVYMFACTIPKL